MKNRKKETQIKIECRNARYRKTIIHNRDLAEKNTELSQKINLLQQDNRLLKMNVAQFVLYKIKQFINYIKKLYYEIIH